MVNQFTYRIDIDELIFALKNKEYGAYELRKTYKTHLSIAMWLAILFFILATIGPVFYGVIDYDENISISKREPTLIELLNPPSIEKQKDVQSIETIPQSKPTIKFTPPIVKPDELVQNEFPMVRDFINIEPGTKTQEGVEGGLDYTLIEPEEKVIKPVEEESIVYSYVEEMPSFPGGDQELYKFLSENIRYTEIAKRAGIEGKLILQMTISSNGKINDIIIVKGLPAGLDEEAIRVIRSMPNWIPGKQNGRPVNVRVSIPIVFKLQ